MEGLYISNPVGSGGFAFASNGIELMARHGELEIMSQPIVANATVWLVPSGDTDSFEFFFVHSGELEIELDGEKRVFLPGDSFYVHGLRQEVFLKARKNSVLLYISDSAVYDASAGFQEELTKLVVQINEKDNYTFKHSRNVMRYSVRLYENLRYFCACPTADDIVVASLFHDVGKCYVPDEILKKKGSLTQAEYQKIIRHPIDSARLLSPHFNDRVVELSQSHHERLNGSGYPFGLFAEDISFEARILAVADVFDAMTTDRGYNKVKSFEDAADELCSLPEQFDTRITGVLARLVRSGAFSAADEDERV